jgi:hypothetical protein
MAFRNCGITTQSPAHSEERFFFALVSPRTAVLRKVAKAR